MTNMNSTHKPEQPNRVAVVGSGISGLAAAWLLSRKADVTLFEADRRLGGHAHTVDVSTADGRIPVDTGFIVYNERNYPNLVALFAHLGVPTQQSDMSFSASLDAGQFEYSGTSLTTMFGQRSNIVRLRFWRMLGDILRFYREAPACLATSGADGITLGDFLDMQGYSKSFVEDHILPMGAAIWSTTAREMRAYPLRAFIRFFESHGLLSLSDRPTWRTVKGGSREYVNRIVADFEGSVRLNTPVVSLRRTGKGVVLTTADGRQETFDNVVLATHADRALSILADADGQERSLLGAFRYTSNEAVLHSDPSLMPKRRPVWASWNYIAGTSQDSQLCVTYWMNRLQNIDRRHPLFLTLNPSRPISPDLVHGTFEYTHPLFDAAALAAQRRLWNIQGRGGVWFCGAHFGSGFHEDGLQSGLAVAEDIAGIRRPWTVAAQSARIFVPQPLVAAE